MALSWATLVGIPMAIFAGHLSPLLGMTLVGIPMFIQMVILLIILLPFFWAISAAF